MKDEIIDEIRKYREELAAESGFDSHEIFVRARERQANRKTVNLQGGHERPTCISTTQQVAEPQTPYGL
jgi:hypothetical protein